MYVPKVVPTGESGMIKTLTKHGNSHALVIEKPILELLNIDPDTPIQITTDGEVLILSPLRDTERKTRFEKALAETNEEFGRALKRLAD
jgi:antitoxin component of MazEF toxin-antitoxin module